MIKLCDCDYCKNNIGMKNGHTICYAFRDGVPYDHANQDLKKLNECANGYRFVPVDNFRRITNDRNT